MGERPRIGTGGIFLLHATLPGGEVAHSIHERGLRLALRKDGLQDGSRSENPAGAAYSLHGYRSLRPPTLSAMALGRYF